MSTVTDLGSCLVALTGAGDLEPLGSYGLPAKWVEQEGDPARAVSALTDRITAILQES